MTVLLDLSRVSGRAGKGTGSPAQDDPAASASEVDNLVPLSRKAYRRPKATKLQFTVSAWSDHSSYNDLAEHVFRFVGPPGTEKTSLGQLIARTLGRPFQYISLGGVHDESEIQGHRQTCVSSGPVLLVQVLRRAGRMHPDLLPEFTYTMTAMTTEMRSIRLADQITTVNHQRRCLKFSIRSKTWPSTCVSSDNSPRAEVCSDTDGL